MSIPDRTAKISDITRYPGSKYGSGVFQNIINVFPIHDIYIEAFLGSAAIMKKKDASAINIGFDISQSIIERCVACPGFQFYHQDSILFLSAASSLINAIHAGNQKILIYCDPPYPFDTRRSDSKIYRNEMHQEHHAIFLDAILKLSCYVVVSSYKNPIYDHALLAAGWSFKSFKTVTRQGPAIETIYFNFPLDLPKHQYDYIGNNYREREAAKRRVFSTASKINRMHPDEKNYLLNILHNDFKN